MSLPHLTLPCTSVPFAQIFVKNLKGSFARFRKILRVSQHVPIRYRYHFFNQNHWRTGGLCIPKKGLLLPNPERVQYNHFEAKAFCGNPPPSMPVVSITTNPPERPWTFRGICCYIVIGRLLLHSQFDGTQVALHQVSLFGGNALADSLLHRLIGRKTGLL